jgi:hypothetical protein
VRAGVRARLPLTGEEEEEKNIFSTMLPEQSMSAPMAKKRPNFDGKLTKFGGIQTGNCTIHSSAHGLFSSGLGCRNFHFTYDRAMVSSDAELINTSVCFRCLLQQEVEMQVDNNATNTRYRVLAWKSKAT